MNILHDTASIYYRCWSAWVVCRHQLRAPTRWWCAHGNWWVVPQSPLRVGGPTPVSAWAGKAGGVRWGQARASMARMRRGPPPWSPWTTEDFLQDHVRGV